MLDKKSVRKRRQGAGEGRGGQSLMYVGEGGGRREETYGGEGGRGRRGGRFLLSASLHISWCRIGCAKCHESARPGTAPRRRPGTAAAGERRHTGDRRAAACSTGGEEQQGGAPNTATTQTMSDA